MFGIELIDAGLLPAMLIALVAGLLSFLSPCVLPIVPPYLAYMSGITVSDLNEGRTARAILPALFFVLGLSTVFLFLGFTASVWAMAAVLAVILAGVALFMPPGLPQGKKGAKFTEVFSKDPAINRL
ncbi:cytochrome c biogenesis protein CcdA, partial [Escherichia coli]|nr:cytochrome c biogenesis protein CcdA [Escherichia coli]